MDPSKLTVLRSQIWDLVQTERLDDDLKQIRRERHADHVHSWDERITEQGVPRGLESLSGRGFAHLLEDLDAYLCDLGRAQIHGGLHVFGVAPVGDALVDLMFAVLYSPNGSIPSLVEAVTQACGISSAALRDRHGVWPDSLAPVLARALSTGHADVVTVGQVRTAVERVARELLLTLAAREFVLGAVEEVVASHFLIGVSAPARGAVGLGATARDAVGVSATAGDAARVSAKAGDAVVVGTAARLALADASVDALRATLRFACEVLAPNLARTTDETHNLLAALDGRYVPAGPSGAPSRGMAHVLPTGRNFYTVDPRGLPTPAAWTTGVSAGRRSTSKVFRRRRPLAGECRVERVGHANHAYWWRRDRASAGASRREAKVGTGHTPYLRD